MATDTPPMAGSGIVPPGGLTDQDLDSALQFFIREFEIKEDQLLDRVLPRFKAEQAGRDRHDEARLHIRPAALQSHSGPVTQGFRQAVLEGESDKLRLLLQLNAHPRLLPRAGGHERGFLLPIWQFFEQNEPLGPEVETDGILEALVVDPIPGSPEDGDDEKTGDCGDKSKDVHGG